MQGASFTGADLRDVDLEGADLEGASLWYAKFKDAILLDANLTDVRGDDILTGAILTDADLQSAYEMGVRSAIFRVENGPLATAPTWVQDADCVGQEDPVSIDDIPDGRGFKLEAENHCYDALSLAEMRRNNRPLLGPRTRIPFTAKDINRINAFRTAYPDLRFPTEVAAPPLAPPPAPPLAPPLAPPPPPPLAPPPPPPLAPPPPPTGLFARARARMSRMFNRNNPKPSGGKNRKIRNTTRKTHKKLKTQKSNMVNKQRRLKTRKMK